MEKTEDELELFPANYREEIKGIIERCKKSNIKYEIISDSSADFEDAILGLKLLRGRNYETILIEDMEDAHRISNIDFEKYVFLESYEGICCYEDGTVEAIVRPLRKLSSDRIMRGLLGLPPIFKTLKGEKRVFELESKRLDRKKINVCISAPTNEMLVLIQLAYIWIDDEPDELTVKISGLEIGNNKEAVSILEKIANSLFFEINDTKKIPMMLDVHREPLTLGSTIARQKEKKTKPVSFPRYQYDVEPMNLFWYAKSANQMRLLQFLAYYQVLECYFPTYTSKEVQAEVKNIMKEPTFDPDDNKDMNRVINSVLSKMKRGYGDEKSQLLATVRGCVTDQDVVEILETSHIDKYFENNYKELSKHRISRENKDVPLVNQLAERIYDIRCKIVHTKSEEYEFERILPFTRQEVFLRVENEIMEFIAKKVLIAGSRKLIV